jgi:hypothetical protein
MAAIDPESGGEVSIFNPREMAWSDHFGWSDYLVVGRTPIGRATVKALQMNHPRRVMVRRSEQRFDLFPPKDSEH